MVKYLYVEFDFIHKILAMDCIYEKYHLNFLTNYLVRTSQRTLFLPSLKQTVSST